MANSMYSSTSHETITMDAHQGESRLGAVIHGSGFVCLAEKVGTRFIENRSSFYLEVERYSNNEVSLSLRGSTTVGVTSTPDGCVCQVARLCLRRSRTGASQFYRNWARFIRVCVTDDTITSEELDVIRLVSNTDKARIDLAILSNHAEPHYDANDLVSVASVLYDLATLAPYYIQRMLMSMYREYNTAKVWVLD